MTLSVSVYFCIILVYLLTSLGVFHIIGKSQAQVLLHLLEIKNIFLHVVTIMILRTSHNSKMDLANSSVKIPIFKNATSRLANFTKFCGRVHIDITNKSWKCQDWYHKDWLFYRTVSKMPKKLVYKIQNDP